MPEKGTEAERMLETVRGKKFNHVYDDYLRPRRHAIGHVLLEDMNDEYSAERPTDEFDFVSDVYLYLPVAHHIARTMIENDFGVRGMAQLILRLDRGQQGS